MRKNTHIYIQYVHERCCNHNTCMFVALQKSTNWNLLLSVARMYMFYETVFHVQLLRIVSSIDANLDLFSRRYWWKLQSLVGWTDVIKIKQFYWKGIMYLRKKKNNTNKQDYNQISKCFMWGLRESALVTTLKVSNRHLSF